MSPGQKRRREKYKQSNAVKVTGRKRKRLADHLFIHHSGKCFWCDCNVERSVKAGPLQATIDHLKTKLEGRENYFDGGHVLACAKCNSQRENNPSINDRNIAVNYSSLLFSQGLSRRGSC